MPPNSDPQASGYIIAQLLGVQAAGIIQGQRNSGEHSRKHCEHVVPGSPVHTARHPEIGFAGGNRRAHDNHQCRGRFRCGRQADADQHEPDGRHPFFPRQAIDQQGYNQRSRYGGGGQQLDAHTAAQEGDEGYGCRRRSARNPDNIRRGQRIADDPLQNRTGYAQCRADKQCGKYPRQPQGHNNKVIFPLAAAEYRPQHIRG
ncbi:hypothetical protein D3C73_1192060 [compost metagenome]